MSDTCSIVVDLLVILRSAERIPNIERSIVMEVSRLGRSDLPLALRISPELGSTDGFVSRDQYVQSIDHLPVTATWNAINTLQLGVPGRRDRGGFGLATLIHGTLLITKASLNLGADMKFPVSSMVADGGMMLINLAALTNLKGAKTVAFGSNVIRTLVLGMHVFAPDPFK